MWFQKTPLLPSVAVQRSADSLREYSLSNALAEREAALRAFAIGEIPLDLRAISDPNARFIDVHAAVHGIKSEFNWNKVLGIDVSDYVLNRHEFISNETTAVSIVGFTQSGVKTQRPHFITWTVVWIREGETWLILNSHASRS